MSKWNCTDQIHPACSCSPSQSPKNQSTAVPNRLPDFRILVNKFLQGEITLTNLEHSSFQYALKTSNIYICNSWFNSTFTTLQACHEEKNWRYSEPRIACLSISFLPWRFFYWLQLIFYGLVNFEIFLCIKEVDWGNGPCQQVVLSLELVLPTPGFLESVLIFFLVNMCMYIHKYTNIYQLIKSC